MANQDMTDQVLGASGALPFAETLDFTVSAEPYPVPRHVFDRLVEKFVNHEKLSERELRLLAYATELNEVYLAERKLGLVSTSDSLALTDEEAEALGLAPAKAEVSVRRTFAEGVWYDHDGGERPFAVGGEFEIEVRNGIRRVGGAGDEFIWRWDEDVSDEYNIVRFRILSSGDR